MVRSAVRLFFFFFFFLPAIFGTIACEKKTPPPATEAASSPDGSAPKPVTSVAGRAQPTAQPAEKVEIDEVHIRADGATNVRVIWKAPAGTAVNDDAPFRVRWNRSDGLAEAPPDVKSTGNKVKDGFTVTVRPMAGAPVATLGGDIDIVICDAATHSVCVPVKRSLELGFMSQKGAPSEARVEVPLPEAKAQ